MVSVGVVVISNMAGGVEREETPWWLPTEINGRDSVVFKGLF